MNPADIKALIDQLLKTGEILATKSFEIAVRQIYVEAVQNFAAAFAFLLLFMLGIYIIKQSRKAHYGDLWEDTEFFGWIASVAGGLIFWFPLMEGISRLINPQWYAVKLLLETFLRK